MEFEKLYFQKMDTIASDKSVVTYPIKETIKDFFLYCVSTPFKICGKAKDIPVTDFKDEDGKVAFHPAVLKMDSYEMDVEFGYKGEKKTANQYINNFIKYLTGRDGTGTALSMYNTYTLIGRQDVMFKELHDDATLVRDGDGDILIFKITFTVNDPVTDVLPAYENGVLKIKIV